MVSLLGRRGGRRQGQQHGQNHGENHGENGPEDGAGNHPASGQRDDRDLEAANRALGLNTGWNVFGYLVGGMIAYGGMGALIGRAVHVQLLFPIGMLVGLAISVGWIIYKYGRP